MKNVKNIGDKITYTIDANEKVYGNGVITDVFDFMSMSSRLMSRNSAR